MSKKLDKNNKNMKKIVGGSLFVGAMAAAGYGMTNTDVYAAETDPTVSTTPSVNEVVESEELTNTVNAAEAAGMKVTQEENQVYNSKEEAQADYDKQTQELSGKLDQYNQAMNEVEKIRQGGVNAEEFKNGKYTASIVTTEVTTEESGVSWQKGTSVEAGAGAKKVAGGTGYVSEIGSYYGTSIEGVARTAIQGTGNENKDANFSNIYEMKKSGSIWVRNTSNGDVKLTFSDFVDFGPAVDGSHYVTIWGANDGGIAWGVFSRADGTSVGASDGESGGGSGTAGSSGRLLNLTQSYNVLVETTGKVADFTFNDIDNKQTVVFLDWEDFKEEKGKNISSPAKGTYSAGAGDVSQASGNKLDSNSVRQSWNDTKKRAIKLTHFTQETTGGYLGTPSIVAGIFGVDSMIERTVKNTIKKEVVIPEGKYHLNEVKTFTIKVNKVDSEELQNITGKDFEFTVYSDDALTDVVSTLSGDEETGIASFTVQNGKYYIKETKAPAGFLLSESVIKVEVKNGELFINEEAVEFDETQTATVDYENELITFTIKVNKVDSITKQNITGSDFEFTVYSDPELKNVVEVIVGDDDTGYVTFHAKEGVYFIKETKAPKGYLLSDEVVKVEIKDGVLYVNDKEEDVDESYTYSFEYQDSLMPIEVKVKKEKPAPKPEPTPAPKPEPTPAPTPVGTVQTGVETVGMTGLSFFGSLFGLGFLGSRKRKK